MSLELQRKFQILALSGGGYRGLYTAQVLADLEEEFGGPIGQRFDLITGTSVGGIIAIAIALEIPMKKVVELFVEHGQEIFKKRPWYSRWFGYKRSNYTNDGLKQLLNSPELFGEKILADLKHPTIIPSINYTEGKPVVFKTPHHVDFRRDWRLKLVDVALATSAAPMYFPRYMIDNQQYVDGGLCANNPNLLGLHEADYFFNIDINNIALLSIGTLSSKRTVNASNNKDGGLIDWAESKYKLGDSARNIIDLTLANQQMLMQQIADHRLKRHNGVSFKIDENLVAKSTEYVGLDLVSKWSQETLIGNAHASSKIAISKTELIQIMEHISASPKWHHGPYKNI